MEKESKFFIDYFLIAFFKTGIILWLIFIVEINNFIPTHDK